MSNRVVINVYDEDRETSSQELIYTDVVVTSLSAAGVVDYFEVSEGFYAHVIEGHVLSFVDFSCITVSSENIIKKVKELPLMDEEPVVDLPGRCTIHFKSETNEELLPRSATELVYTYSRFECGASGFAETVIQWAMDHPIEMMLIGIPVGNLVNAFWNKLKFWICKKRRKGAFEYEKNTPISFDPKKFQKNFSKMMNIEFFGFQLTGITPLHRGKHMVSVRTVKNKEYEVTVKADGSILSYKEV